MNPGTNLMLVSPVSTGSTTLPVLKIGNQSICWATSAPTVGTWITGDLAIHVVPATGQPFGWTCTVSGTPGTWRPLANVL